jgi:predicted nucleic acid-binding protein
MTVVDASAIVDLLVPPDVERRDFMIAQLPEPGEPWLAPDLLPFEVFSAIRRHAMRRVLGDAPAGAALRRLLALPIELVPTLGLLDAAWQLRHGFSAADSLYAVLALRAREPLLTSDARFAQAAARAGIHVRQPAQP